MNDQFLRPSKGFKSCKVTLFLMASKCEQRKLAFVDRQADKFMENNKKIVENFNRNTKLYSKFSVSN